MIIYDILLLLQYQVSTTVMDLIVVFCIVSCLYLCLPCCVSVSLPNFRWIKIYIPLSWEHWKTRWPDNTHLLLTDYFLFIYWYPRDAMLARVLAIMALYLSVCLSVCLSVSVSVCHKSVFYRNGWTNRADVWYENFLPPVLHCVWRKFSFLRKQDYLPLELCPKLRTQACWLCSTSVSYLFIFNDLR